MKQRGITLVELLLAAALAGLLAAGAMRLLLTSTDQQRAVLQGTGLQAELRRANSVSQQALSERPFLLPLRGSGAGLEFLQALPESRFRVLGVSSSGLTVRFGNPGYDPRALTRAVVVDSGGNGYVYTLTRVALLDGNTGTYSLEGTACTVPGGSGLRGVGAVLSRFGNGAALNTFAGGGSLGAGALFFQQEGQAPEPLMSAGAPQLRYVYRASDGQTLYGETPALFQQAGGQRYDLAGLSLDFQALQGEGSKQARRALEGDLLFQADSGLGLRQLDCNPLSTPPLPGVGDWRVEVGGLDPGVSALVPIAGPRGYARTLSGSTTLSGLDQGTYSLSAQSVANPGLPFVRYRPSTPAEGSSLGVEVGGANRPVTQVRYARVPGRLRVQVEGLPAGATVSLGAGGSFQSYTFVVGNGESRWEVEAGQYTLAWPSFPDPGGRGTWGPDRSGYSLNVPSEGEGDGGTVRYTLRANPYRLNLQVQYSGGGSPPTDPYICIQPSRELAGPIDSNATLGDCLFNP